MTMTPEQFQVVKDFAFREAGISLEDGKEYLVESRMRPVLKRLELADIGELTTKLTGFISVEVREAMLDALTINETSFFRDTHPFTALREDILPALIEDRQSQREINIMSSASSTGQEAYSIAMLVREDFPQLSGWRINIIGGDISDEAVEKARRGQYTQMEVNRGLPAQLLIKYFDQRDNNWQISDELRSMVEFRKMNICQPWTELPRIDLVMLRNVLIYFDLPTREFVLGQANKVLADDGFLFLGASETLLSLSTEFDMWKSGHTRCYRHKRHVAAQGAK